MKKGDAQSKASPPVKVVGFRVEGATPSPRDTSLADAAGVASTVTGSPSPVIIPPAFTVSPDSPLHVLQLPPPACAAAACPADCRCSCTASFCVTHCYRARAVAAMQLQPCGALGAPSPHPAPSPPPHTMTMRQRRQACRQSAPRRQPGWTPTLLPRVRVIEAPVASWALAETCLLASPRVPTQPLLAPLPYTDRTPTKAVASPPGRALPLTPVGTSAPADLGGQFAAAASADSPRLLQPTISDAAVAAPAAAVPASAPPAAAVAAPKPSPAKPQQAAQQQPAAAQQQAAKPAAEPAAGPPGEAKKSMKEMSKAERRALQEAQRAAKAAAKAAAQPAAAGGGSGGKPLQKQGSGGNLARQGRQTSDVKEAAKAAAGGEGVAKAGKGAAGAAKGGAAAQKSAADATVPPAKLMAMFAHLPLPRGITLESIAQQKGPPGGCMGGWRWGGVDGQGRQYT